MRNLIRATFPSTRDREEFVPDQSRRRICLGARPIDGTKSFMSGMPAWGTLIGADPIREPVGSG